MAWNEFFTTFFATLGGASIVALGFGKWLGDTWKERIARDEQAKHQIAQEAYKNFFSKKMEAYIELANLKQRYLITKLENVEDPYNYLPSLDRELRNRILGIKKHIQSNNIYLSNELNIKFNDWFEKIIPVIKSSQYGAMEEWSRIQVQAEAMGETAYDLAELEMGTDLAKGMQACIKEWNNLLNQIDKDILELRKKYDL